MKQCQTCKKKKGEFTNKKEEIVCEKCIKKEIKKDFTKGSKYVIKDIKKRPDKNYKEYWDWL